MSCFVLLEVSKKEIGGLVRCGLPIWLSLRAGLHSSWAVLASAIPDRHPAESERRHMSVDTYSKRSYKASFTYIYFAIFRMAVELRYHPRWARP
jgi:hypothetical protein